MQISESVVVVLKYEPAWSFAELAKKWYEKVSQFPFSNQISEASLLVFIYSNLSLEAFISEMLVSRTTKSQYQPLFKSNATLTTRWSKGTKLCAGKTQAPQRALQKVLIECKDRGNYGLMVRARNKLIHPRVHIEILDKQGHKIRNDSLERLVSDLQQPPASLPDIKPAFPKLIKCGVSAKWSLLTLSRMVRLFHDAVGESLSESWEKVLINVDT